MAAPVAPPTIAPIAAPRPPSNAPPKIAPAAPPRIAPPTGSCAAASCIGAAKTIINRAAAPRDRYIVSPLKIKMTYQRCIRMRRNRGGPGGEVLLEIPVVMRAADARAASWRVLARRLHDDGSGCLPCDGEPTCATGPRLEEPARVN